ncbi:MULTISPECIES: D-ribose pyranase [Limnochorda]|uniref:D-ribose pyranase n=1 Tax=Limnochorda TaxID=1676651 RepID=UPI0017F9FDCC|nr:D-ribose pyranase [Limnochorda pilosa]MBO2486235.1 D-ribose pyranase [Bacillota bacterium]MBO2519629.1 D-ribose pyranase [Bacillota bacterium]NMA71533.1 D-ribose pyranase [Bacillota bacterium]
MRRQGILHPQISRIISEMGHTDGLVVADAGLPIPKGVERVDLAFLPGVPSFLTVLDGILAELSIEGALLAQEIQEANPTLWREVQSRLQVPIEYVPHQRFKERLPSVRAVIRTGECTPYANVILFSSTQGIFPG